MLTQLTIKNFGLIDSSSIDFTKGLNILTGSTGAGKSIIIDGLHFVLGDRLKSSQIRDTTKPCIIETVFDLSNTILFEQEEFKDFFANQDGEAVLIINRQYLPDGRSKVKVNGFAITVAQLKSVGDRLIDFHGANDHQMLLSEEFHLGMLDQLVDFGDLKEKYLQSYAEYVHLQNQLKALQSMSSSRDRDMELLEHQIMELEQVPLSTEKYEELCQDQVRINNAEKLYECGAALIQVFENQDAGLSEIIRQAFGPMKTLNQIDENTGNLQEYLTNIQENSDQLSSELRDYLDSLSFQPEEADDVNRRYNIYDDIKRKYGPTLEDAQNFYQEAKQKYDFLTNIEHNDAELKQQIETSEKSLKQIARKLTNTRKKTATLLKETIEKELKDLGIDHVAFEARIETGAYNDNGHDKVVFYISPNAGEDLKPLAEIVSSGEAARVMLALKKALTKVDPIPILIFDEIDAQIGGRLGTITGRKLKELSSDRQVILITHLPQIASFSDVHFKVVKEVIKGRTITNVKLLDKKAQVEELAHMMDGSQKGNISLSHAQDMLANAGK